MYTIKNTALDRMKHIAHRTAPKFEEEPSLGGYRIRLGTSYDISDEHYQRVKPTLDEWVKNGMVEVFHVNGRSTESTEDRGPTFEEWTRAGYPPENYPPKGYSEVFSPGLVTYRRAQEAATAPLIESRVEIVDTVETVTIESVVEQPTQIVEQPVQTTTQPIQTIPLPPPIKSFDKTKKKL